MRMKMIMKMKMKMMKINKKLKIMMKQWIRTKKRNNKRRNDNLDKIIDKSKSFEEQIESLKKVENLEGYYFYKDYDDKELKFKIFKLKLAHLSNEIDEDLFEQIFGHTLIKLADKLINTTDKEENQITVKNMKKKKKRINFLKKMNMMIG